MSRGLKFRRLLVSLGLVLNMNSTYESIHKSDHMCIQSPCLLLVEPYWFCVICARTYIWYVGRDIQPTKTQMHEFT